MKTQLYAPPLILMLLIACTVPALADPPTCTTHFFDWYTIQDENRLAQMQRHWTYQIDWGAFGIATAEIGNSVRYYQVQFEKIREAGFDGIHYEWHNNNPKPEFLEALREARMPAAMFYDMQIRFSKRPNFIHPSPEFADECVRDVCSFYETVPRDLWLHDRNGCLPIVVYGYAFDQSVKDPETWQGYFSSLISGIESKLHEPIALHWTYNRSPQQMYGYQHFPQIQSYIFNEAQRQPQINTHSTTFVVHYDDLGVHVSRGGNRPRRWIRNDIRYLQEGLWLAKHTNPDLVFHYGWNELFEGEHILPDTRWGAWRYELASAMVKSIKKHAAADLPKALIIVDDFLPALYRASPDEAALLRDEMDLLIALRRFVPQAQTVTPGSLQDFSAYDLIICLNAGKNSREEDALGAFDKCIIYANPHAAATTPLTKCFTEQPRRPFHRPSRADENEFVAAGRKINVDLGQYPILKYRCRNDKDSFFHIRCAGVNDEGKEVNVWYENGPTDDRQTLGKWQEAEANMADVAKRAAGTTVSRLTRLEIILDDADSNGEFTLDIVQLMFTNREGKVGWAADFTSLDDWTVRPSFAQADDARTRYSFATHEADGATMARMTLKAVVPTLSKPAEVPLQSIQPTEGAEVLCRAAPQDTATPLILSRGRRFLMNTLTPSDETLRILMGAALNRPLNRGVIFQGFSHAVNEDGLSAQTDTAWTIIQEEELLIERIRFVAPPELDQPMAFTLPKSSRALSLRVLQGDRETIPWPDPGSDPPTITLLPGEVVELVKQ